MLPLPRAYAAGVTGAALRCRAPSSFPPRRDYRPRLLNCPRLLSLDGAAGPAKCILSSVGITRSDGHMETLDVCPDMTVWLLIWAKFRRHPALSGTTLHAFFA